MEELIGPEGPFENFFACYVPDDHSGPCAVSYSDSKGTRRWAVFPSRESAITAASGACRYDVGGYTSVAVYPVSDAHSEGARYQDANEWLFDVNYDLEEPVEQTGMPGLVRRFMREMVRRIAANPSELAQVEWRDLERLLSEVFGAIGFNVTLTRPSKDGGFDLRLEADGSVYLVEVKHWSAPSRVGAGVIKHFTDIVVANGAEGLLLSTSGFTNKAISARLEVSTFPVRLASGQKVIALCRHFVANESGVLVLDGGLPGVLFADAF